MAESADIYLKPELTGLHLSEIASDPGVVIKKLLEWGEADPEDDEKIIIMVRDLQQVQGAHIVCEGREVVNLGKINHLWPDLTQII